MLDETLNLPRARNYFFSAISLCKMEISLFSAFSALSGLYLISAPSLFLLAAVTAGVLLTACGAGALNHYQERNSDALMPRTAGRPLPSGRVGPAFALRISFVLIGSGSVVLGLTGSFAPPLLGLAAVFWYNGFYTWFKGQSPFAAVPGALVGAIPPAIGWTAGGGNIADVRLAVLCFFFFVWQILHFWVHSLTYAAEYEQAGLPSISTVLTERQRRRLAFQWLLALVVSTLFLGLFDIIHSFLTSTATVCAAFWLALRGLTFISNRQTSYSDLFRQTNYYMLLVMALLALDGYFHFSRTGTF